ncbi:hypothetical protein FORC066_2175 [Yersinia enterocolitica]|nr:hypothetical protein FORC065_2305 [Yersinia enterocolitica]UXD29387.1 hypothetical protein FORC066_2175 [Yersinia enterocolitica]
MIKLMFVARVLYPIKNLPNKKSPLIYLAGIFAIRLLISE